VLLARAALATGDEAIGVKLGLLLAPQALGLFSYVVSTSASLGDALECGQRFFHLVGRRPPEVERFEGSVALVFPSLPGTGPTASYARQLRIGLTFGLLHQLLGTRWSAKSVQLSSLPTSAACRREIERTLRCPVRFGRGRDAVHFRTELLEASLEGADPERHALLREIAARDPRLSAARNGEDTNLIARVEEVCALLLPGGELTIEAVARRVGLGPRTMQRRLASAGVSFRELVDATRRRECSWLLRNTRLSLDEIAARAGFRTTAGFHRAFKRWTGKTPRRMYVDRGTCELVEPFGAECRDAQSILTRADIVGIVRNR
jgi:AraC-like DNA-binding protein